ncbi:GbsR/MarR family transcriptional regulator [Streptomyces tubbatahanensis]|uniref:GbsR/MarR family transcriptional regulator n=1 Tax=Streptomyces tubbatahanensis TaxID=2923272 RepID=UPI003C7025BF
MTDVADDAREETGARTGENGTREAGKAGTRQAGGEETGSRLREYEERASPFVERFAADLTEAGMQRMASRAFACLLASEEGALTSAELGRRLQASPAAISGAVRYLSQVGMVSRQRDPGSRRERYLLHQDVWYTSLLSRDNLLNRWQTTLTTGADALGGDSPGGRRLAESAEFLRFMQRELEEMLKRWHERQRD